MELLIMRHTDAVDGYGDDFNRTLSEKGRKQADKMGEWLRVLKMHPDVMVTSPLLRTVETAKIIAKKLDMPSTPKTDERLVCGMTPGEADGLILESGSPDGRLMLVGHAPDLGALVAHLIGAEAGSIEMRKGAVACLQTDRPGRSGSTLRWLITPKL